MALAAIPSNFNVQQGNQEVLVSWDNAAGATTYTVQRSPDGVTYSTLATPAVSMYLDTTAVLGTMCYYRVASTNGTGTSSYTRPQQVVPAPEGELSLFELRKRSQERADRVGSQFVTNNEWNFFINQACLELYDILITVYEDYAVATEVTFQTNGSDIYYALPDGSTSFVSSETGLTVVAAPFYKLLGLDYAVNLNSQQYVTLNKYNLIDRNRYQAPNAPVTSGSIDLQYRLMGNRIRFIPLPTSGLTIKIIYAPRLETLLADTDITTIGYSGWLQYVICRAAKYALDKEESDTSKIDEELMFLNKRILGAAPNKDAGQPDRISDTRGGSNWGYNGGFGSGM